MSWGEGERKRGQEGHGPRCHFWPRSLSFPHWVAWGVLPLTPLKGVETEIDFLGDGQAGVQNGTEVIHLLHRFFKIIYMCIRCVPVLSNLQVDLLASWERKPPPSSGSSPSCSALFFFLQSLGTIPCLLLQRGKPTLHVCTAAVAHPSSAPWEGRGYASYRPGGL